MKEATARTRRHLHLGIWTVGVAVVLCTPVSARPRKTVVIGSKAFPESWILGDALTALAQQTGTVDAVHRSNLGGTEIVYKALLSGSIDIYPEYTGTIDEVLMKSSGRPTKAQMRAFLREQGIGMSDSLGFNDGYALAVTPATQERYRLARISDLANHPDLRLAFTHEFIGRKDGWAGLSERYGLSMKPRGIDHSLAYEAIASGQIDVTEIYTTDAQIERLKLRLLQDDRAFFPRYDAVLLYRLDLPRRAPAAFAAMAQLVGKIDERKMTHANALVVLEKKPSQQAAAGLVREALGVRVASVTRSPAREIARHTVQHLELVAISLLAAILIGVPLGIVAARARLLASATLAGAGLLQTIPSLALLAFLIPLLGIGTVPALVALFLYSLLPIVRNTYVGLTTVPPQLSEAADALGLSPRAKLLRVSLPMASPAILAGIKTSAVINVGTATIAAIIGAEGLGTPILQGITLLDTHLILEGAIPAALLALLVQWSFDLLDRVIIPRGLRL
jgi:osmoprotectant transport system permease protein